MNKHRGYYVCLHISSLKPRDGLLLNLVLQAYIKGYHVIFNFGYHPSTPNLNEALTELIGFLKTGILRTKLVHDIKYRSH
jgi:hypothetical protein